MPDDFVKPMPFDPEKALDVTGPVAVEVTIRNDKKVIWVNIDGVCMLRVCRIESLTINEM